MPFEVIERAFVEDHVIITQPGSDGTQAITLSGIKGIIKQGIFFQIGVLPSEQDLTQLAIVDSKPPKLLFDTFTATSNISEFPSIRILNASDDVLLHGINIQVMVIASKLSKKETIVRLNDFGALKRFEELGLADSLKSEIYSFISEFRKDLPKTEDGSIDKIQDFFEIVSSSLGTNPQTTEYEVDSKMDIIEEFVCSKLYQNLFTPKWADDDLHDEKLQSKIQALNMLEIGLSNLGVVVKPHQVSNIDEAVHLCGAELKKLAEHKAPGKMVNIIVQCHRILVETLDRRSPKPSSATTVKIESQNSMSDTVAIGSSNLGIEHNSDISPSTSPSLTSLSISNVSQDSSNTSIASPPSIPVNNNESPVYAASTSTPSPSIPVNSNESPIYAASTSTPSSSIPVNNSESPPAYAAIDHTVSTPVSEPSLTTLTSTKNEVRNKNNSVTSSSEHPSVSPIDTTVKVDSASTTPTSFGNPPMSPISPFSPEMQQSSNADAILPMLIFIVVKSNPNKLIANLRYIHRYRVRAYMYGEAAYCLTNIMAVVSFLENVDLAVLGLSPEKVLSDVAELQQSTVTAIGRRMGDNIVGVADSGIKVITGVVDTSYKFVVGRILGYHEAHPMNIPTPGNKQTGINSSNSHISAGLSGKGDVKELTELNSPKSTDLSPDAAGKEEYKSLTDRIITVIPRLSIDRSVPPQSEVNKKSKTAEQEAKKISPPIKRFVDCPVEDFRVSDVAELLADYKRLSAAIKDLNLFSP